MVLGVRRLARRAGARRRSPAFDAPVAPGPTIVLLALAGFALTWPLGVLAAPPAAAAGAVPARCPRPARTTSTDEHAHEHGPDCGHPAVPHGDHVDYVHDGHRHAAHGEHYDEH